MEGLSESEKEIAILVARGFSNRQIATQLGYKPQTIRNYLSTIYKKLGITHRAELAVFALRSGLVDDQAGEQPG